MVRTTSTNFISGTGLKKCRPTKRSGRLVAVISSVMESEEVLLAKIASFLTMASSAAYILRFSSRFSMMASMMRSQSARSCFLVVPFSRARMAAGGSFSPPLSAGFSASLARDFSMPAKPLSRNFCSASSTVTSRPAVAETWAMPEPIRPQPSTPTLRISIRDPFVLTTETQRHRDNPRFEVRRIKEKGHTSYFEPALRTFSFVPLCLCG